MRSFMNIETIHELHRVLGLPNPLHPLISIVDFSKTQDNYSQQAENLATNMYALILKSQLPGEMKYGRKLYDFQEGTLMLLAPGQIMSIETDPDYMELEGWGLFFHPDLLRRSVLAQKMDTYSFFSYDLNESLHLSDKEKQILTDTVKRIEEELSDNLDTVSQPLIVTSIELMLNYCTRFYNRQFVTRANFDSEYITRFKNLLSAYFKTDLQLEYGLPSVSYFAEKLHLSPKYFSDMVRSETGRNAQGHIHDHILDMAKNKLLSTSNSVSEIAYSLGFEYPQYFSKMFKKKTGMSPKAYIEHSAPN